MMSSESTAPRRRGRTTAIIAFGLVGLLLLVVAVVAGGYLASLQNAYQKRDVVGIERGPSDGTRPEAGSGTNILLLGSDRRSPEEAQASGVYGQRSDVMMLVHVPDDGSAAYVMSFPRDLYVPIPGHGKDRINAALAFGGLSLAVATVEDYVGVQVDNVALIDFEGIQGMIDSLGGITVNVPQSFEADGHTFTQGPQQMDGEQALVFVRARMMLAGGDFDRNVNQQRVLQGIVSKLISRDALSDPAALQDAVESISPFLTTDDGLTSGRIAELAWANRSIRGGDMHFFSIPHGGPTTTSGGASVVATDEASMDVLRAALRDGTVADYYAEHAGS